MHFHSRKKMGFKLSPLHRKREPHAFHYLSQRASFWVASFSLIAFVAGNMIGQHGWYAFWKSVMGGMDDSLIVYTGTVAPIEKVPDYERWAQFGGDIEGHTYRQVPQDVLVDIPRYHSTLQRMIDRPHGRGNDVYSVGYLGSYQTGAEATGSHPGVDIRVPIGTPVHAIANGIVQTVQKSTGGFGNVVVVRHPNVPDPSDPKKKTTLYSSYAHLSAIYVPEGAIVQKNEHIADSGDTGFVSGPHLHFQIDRDSAPWHPYWPFTESEARSEGMSTAQAVDAGLFQARGYLYTVNPLLYVQANYAPVEMTIVRAAEPAPEIVELPETHVVLSAAEQRTQRMAQLQSRRDDRLRERLARREFAERSIAQVTQPVPSVIRSTEIVASAGPVEQHQIQISESLQVSTVHIRHDGGFNGRGWEKVTLTLLDQNGNPVTSPMLPHDLYLRTAYGTAEFRPATLSVFDFVDGEAEVNMLPRGRRTIVIQIQPLNVLSSPMIYEK